MKKLIIFLLIAAVGLAQPGPVAPAAATQAEVDAGLVKNKYVSPFTLGSWSGGGGGGGGTPGGSNGDWQYRVNGTTFGGRTPATGWNDWFLAPSFANFNALLTGDDAAGLAANNAFTGLNTFAQKISPATNDGAPLGDATHNWSDLFMATGGVWNIADGNWVATHTSGILTVGTGDLRVTTAGTNSASVVTVGGTQTLTGKTLTGPTLTNPTLGVATATSINGNTFTTGTYTLTGAAAKTLTFSNTLTLAGTDGSTLSIGAGGSLGSNAYTSTTYAPLASPTFTGTVTLPTPFTLGAVSVLPTGTELNYVDGVTGAIQTQLNAKQATITFGSGTEAVLAIAPNATGGMVTAGGAPRILTPSSSATPTYNTDNADLFIISSLATTITSMTSSRTGTPVNGQQLEFRIKDDGTARTITWGADFASGIATLPTTTVVNKTLCVYLEFDSVTGDFMCQATGSYP